MSKEKQIDEMARIIDDNHGFIVSSVETAQALYNAGYRKQSEGEWIDNHCSICGMTPIGEETWTRHGYTPPKFEYFMSFCPNCGAKMKGGAE